MKLYFTLFVISRCIRNLEIYNVICILPSLVRSHRAVVPTDVSIQTVRMDLFLRILYQRKSRYTYYFMKSDTVHPLQDLPVIFLGIGVCLYILWHLFIYYPTTCAKYEWMSYGAFTCGLGPGAYILGLAAGLCLIYWFYYLHWCLKKSLE